jgi:hypothetical protein
MSWLSIAGAVFLVWLVLVFLFTPHINYHLSRRTSVRADDFLLANNAQWIGFSMEIGPEGSVYFLDWHDADLCGNVVLQKDSGRVYWITQTVSGAKSWDGR